MGQEALQPNDPIIIWEPQAGPQTALLECPIFEVFYGGARGGGKTDGMLGEWISHADLYAEHAIGVFFRRTFRQLDEAIARAKELYLPLGAEWKEGKATFIFANGARLKFRHLERDSDAEHYQGHSYTRVYIEEITNFPSSKPILRLMATLRSAHGVPCRFRATGNPGGPGHQWVKHRYIDPDPTGHKVMASANGLHRVFIPAKVSDNLILIKSDPTYIARLKGSGSKELVKAWLDGDWTVIEGAFFDEFSSERHVIKPFTIPKQWSRFRSMDWGSASPASIGWWAIVQDDYLYDNGQTTRTLPRGAMVRYREWYVASGPNKGLKLTSEQLAQGIKSREKLDPKMQRSVLDPSAFAQVDGPSIAERMAKEGIWFSRADNKRVATQGAMGGWDQVRARLRGDGEIPQIYFFSTCTDTIRTLPALQHDERNAEDVDTEQEDHAPDEIRYACMSRPYNKPATKEPEDVFRAPTVNELLEEMNMGHD